MRRFWPFGVAFVIALADRISKFYIETHFAAWDVVRVIPGTFQIVYTRNTGIAFSLFENSSEGHTSPLLAGFTLAVLGLVIWLLYQAVRARGEGSLYRAALGLILGGAAGNCYDRVVSGSVTDFLDFYWGSAHFPVFNLADSAITCGAILIILHVWLQPGRENGQGRRGLR